MEERKRKDRRREKIENKQKERVRVLKAVAVVRARVNRERECSLSWAISILFAVLPPHLFGAFLLDPINMTTSSTLLQQGRLGSGVAAGVMEYKQGKERKPKALYERTTRRQTGATYNLTGGLDLGLEQEIV